MDPYESHRSTRRAPDHYYGSHEGRQLCVPVSKKSYVDMVQQLGREVSVARQILEGNRPIVVESDGRTEELIFKVYLMAYDSRKVARLQAQLAITDVKMTAIHMTKSQLSKVLVEITRDHASLQSELHALIVAGR